MDNAIENKNTGPEEDQVVFSDFIFKDQANKKYLLIALAGMVVQLIIFKLLYPFADYFSDSYSFIETAIRKEDFNIWPVGYSKFLYVFHLLTHSDTAVVAFQYLFMGCASLFFFFTICYWYKPQKYIITILFIFLFFNPVFLYLSNYIASDALFSALSLLWFAHLLWIMHRPQSWQILTHTILLAIIFTIRYNAMYYPLVTLVAFFISRFSVPLKLAGIVFPLVLIGAFVAHTRNAAYKVTGTKQFSVLSGWHWANNALYMYPHIQVDSTQIPVEGLVLDRMVRNYFDTIPAAMKDVSPVIGGFYIRYQYGPLKQYLINYWRQNEQASEVTAWGVVAPVFSTYGTHLVKKHPVAYARYYLLPNTLNYFLPPLEKMQIYNLGWDYVGSTAQYWFDYKSPDVWSISKNLQGVLLLFFPAFFMMVNLAFVVGLIWLPRTKKYKLADKKFINAMLLTACMFIVNMGFSVLAAPIAFRYLVFTLVVLFTFVLLLIPFFDEEEKTQDHGVHEEPQQSEQKYKEDLRAPV